MTNATIPQPRAVVEPDDLPLDVSDYGTIRVWSYTDGEWCEFVRDPDIAEPPSIVVPDDEATGRKRIDIPALEAYCGEPTTLRVCELVPVDEYRESNHD